MSGTRLSPGDPGSFSRPENVRVRNMEISFDVEFSKHVIIGNVVLDVLSVDESKELILDTRNLHVKKVLDNESKEELKFTIGDPVLTFGSKLTISLPHIEKREFLIEIQYETDPKSTALQWLSPAQTASGKHPYLFSQCEPDHCRSIIPCQDTPSVKSPYTAKISVAAPYTALMSAVQVGEPEKNGDRTVFRFEQKVPVPAYLIALAVGDLSHVSVGYRTGIWAEPVILEKAKFEFANANLLLEVAEKICGPYVWQIYDILVLPPSFAYGGMENPCLTFITPTLLAGDRSMVNVIAHEIAHSWSGNLVSIKNFEHFWLNEGFTTFLERKIVGRIDGEPARQFAAIRGLKDLRQAIQTFGETNPLTKLVVDLTGIDPDDSFSTCPYEKGHTFLYYLEELVGGPEIFEPFLRAYFSKYQYTSVNTDDFRQFLYSYFPNHEKLSSVDWNLWLNTPGMPPIIPKYDTSLQEACTNLAARWVDWNIGNPCPFVLDDIKKLSSVQLEEFCSILLELNDPLTLDKLVQMNSVYSMDNIRNTEIRFRWLRLCLKSKWKEQVPKSLKFATEQGRAKYVSPIFRDLLLWKEMRDTAIQTFEKHRDTMMHMLVCRITNDINNTAKVSA